MQEESIYNIMNKFKDEEQEALKQKNAQSLVSKTHKINLLKPCSFKETGKAIVANEYYHLLSKDNLVSSFSVPRKDHSTFGLPKGGYLPTKNKENNPNQCKKTTTTCLKTGETNCRSTKNECKPPIPSKNELPIQGLSSNVNFIVNNQKYAQTLKPPKKQSEQDFLKKKDFGTIPDYLDKVKNTIQNEKDFIKMLNESKQVKPETTMEISSEEICKLREGLTCKYNEVNKKYQGLTHITKVNTIGFKRRKEDLEKELAQIERDLNMLQKDRIMVVKND